MATILIRDLCQPCSVTKLHHSWVRVGFGQSTDMCRPLTWEWGGDRGVVLARIGQDCTHNDTPLVHLQNVIFKFSEILQIRSLKKVSCDHVWF